MTLTRIDIDDEALRGAMQLSGASTKTETVNLALRDLAARYRRIAALEKCASQTANWDNEDWNQQRAPKKAPGDIDGWFTELDPFADVPLLDDGRSQPLTPPGEARASLD